MIASSQSKKPQTTLLRWLVISTAGWASLHAIEVGLVGFALAIPIRRLAFPWMVLGEAGLFMSVLIWWGRRPFDSPPTISVARRVAVATALAISAYLVAVLISVVLLGLLSTNEAERGYGPLVLPMAVFIGGITYVASRRRLRRGSQG